MPNVCNVCQCTNQSLEKQTQTKQGPSYYSLCLLNFEFDDADFYFKTFLMYLFV